MQILRQVVDFQENLPISLFGNWLRAYTENGVRENKSCKV